jgi:5'-3' exonuclease
MLFKNLGEKIKIRIGESHNASWISVKHGQEIDIPENIGKLYGFEPVKAFESSIAKTKVETKVIEKKEPKTSQTKDSKWFLEELKSIRGIGKKRAKDIVKVYPNKENLIDAIKSGKHLPFRDDVEEKLKKKYGK